MPRIFIYFSLLVVIASLFGCTNSYPYPNDLPDKGGYSIIIIHSEDDDMEKPEFISNLLENNIYKVIQVYYSKLDNIYPKLDVKSAPYYIFLDSKGIIYETSDINDANNFYNEAINKNAH
ncbi:hypothetical protein KDN24_10630 [Bacillus sp. Bva_UNVM-123]|uniref:hypothetical protein n=1 Tax=Bacillus sp. Bva_UNVM-123 TaxID=2829798 RepID=UPI00391F822E